MTPTQAFKKATGLEIEEGIIEKYCREQGYKLAQKIDDGMAIVVKPRPKWCPEWLYRAVIKDSVEIIHQPPAPFP